MEENYIEGKLTEEPILDLIALPREGVTSETRTVVFGPESDKFAFLVEVEPFTGRMEVTIGNSPAISLLPKFVPEFLRELAEEIESLADRSDFLEYIYGTPVEDEDED